MNNWVVYLVECSDGTLYCGATNNIKRRIHAHNSGKGAKYTRTRLPVTLRIVSKEMTKLDALRLEREVKKKKANKKIEHLKKHM